MRGTPLGDVAAFFRFPDIGWTREPVLSGPASHLGFS